MPAALVFITRSHRIKLLFLPTFKKVAMANIDAYETVVGLEVHARLLTKSKLFSSDSNAFGSAPNTEISPITLAHPGTLPKMNKKAIEFAIKMGLACHCEIKKENYFVRKNYFYPDLPKGYQISQHTTPICKGGVIKIRVDGTEKNIRLNRIHLEEDAGKSLHDHDDHNTSIDFNRAGTPLIEIVSEPDIRSGEEAYAFLTEIRKLVRYLEICDGNMEEGSLRCDANISVKKKNETVLGTRVEIKNLNSIRNVKRAIEFESEQLIGLLQKGETILQQTKSFDADKGTTLAIRDKEEADDYRYFPEPDLTPFHLQDEFIVAIRKTIPELQEERMKRYMAELNLSEYDAAVLTEERKFSDYFESIISHTAEYKAAANWMLGPVKSWMNENNKDVPFLPDGQAAGQAGIGDFPVSPVTLAALIDLVASSKVSFSAAAAKIFPLLLKGSEKAPEQLAMELNLLQQSDASSLEPVIDSILEKFADKVAEYKKGKKGLMALFVGEVMKQTKGKADPKITSELLKEKLKA